MNVDPHSYNDGNLYQLFIGLQLIDKMKSEFKFRLVFDKFI